MRHLRLLQLTSFVCLWVPITLAGCRNTPFLVDTVVREQRLLEVRKPEQLPQIPPPKVDPPITVTTADFSEDSPSADEADPETMELSLNQAIQIGLANSEVVRVLAGLSAVSSGQTIYDPAISNTQIDVARAVFDPAVNFNNVFNRTEFPNAVANPFAPLGAIITGNRIDQHDLSVGVSKQTVTGGSASLNFLNNHIEASPSFTTLNPQDRSNLILSYTQPLFQGAGLEVNLAPIVIARINTERSYFQFKDALQELVRGVIEAYWGVVFAEVDVWARERQVELSQFAADFAQAQFESGLLGGTAGEAAQAQVSLLNFKSALIAARANLLQRQAALRNILGLPPSQPARLVLTTPPKGTRVDPEWEELIRLATERRPDLIELKLIIEADEQRLIQADNQAQPRVDATMFYRWNGLEGRTPTGRFLETGPSEFTDWSLGVNFSVPIGLRQERAALRSIQLQLARDRANLQQGVHQTVHDLADTIRSLDQAFEQYEVLKETRSKALINIRQQLERFYAGIGQKGNPIYLQVLQAITDFGNAVSGEADALTSYNTLLATLERRTGTILETHGIRLYEERFQSMGPLGRHFRAADYPAAVYPGSNQSRYSQEDEPAQNFFDLQDFPELDRIPDPLGEKVPELLPLPRTDQANRQ